jgi:hypothetical protein
MVNGREAGFRDVNDAIRGLANGGPGDQIWEFFCECEDLTCRSLIRLTVREFDDRRTSSPALPILAPDHA